jgi:O-antigen ligase/polysaccharide polymerase Wzy-like membrane protein
MPAEQALTEARKRVGPNHGAGDGSSQAWRARLEESSALIAPLLLIGGLALAGGGFDLSPRHIAGLAVWLVVVGLLAVGAAARARLGPPFYWAAGLILGLALLSAISSLWSGSIELSVTEADRVLVYLGFFLAAFLIAQTDRRRQRFAEGIAISLILIAVAALASRLLPHLVSLGPGLGSGPRLRYPLGYWNADGIVFGIGIGMALWMSRHSLAAGLRWIAVASLPAVLLALYFTYSRGGLLALLVAAGCLLALSHDRLWLLATLAIGALGAMPAVLAAQDRRGLADNLAEPATIDQGVTVLLLLAAGVALALLLYGGLRRLEGRGGGLTGRAVEFSRSPVVLKRIALAGALVAIGVAIAIGGRAWSQFTASDVQFPSQPEHHFGSLSGANRNEFWRVAVDAFGEKPVLGHGAGTYQFSWEQLRSIPLPVRDAHSLFLEAFAELGLVGGLLVLALVGTLLWTGFAAWRAARGSQRELYATLLAAALAFVVGAAIDWFWEIAALGAIFFLASGVLVAARCAQLSQARAAANGKGEERRFGLAVAGLAVAWVTALALVGPLLVDREIKASQAAAADGNLAGAVDHAGTARSIEPWAASPYVQLGLLAEVDGDYATATSRLSQAIHREDRNWLLYYLRSKIEHEAGDTASSRADLRRAQQLNPLESCLREGWDGCG